MSDKSKNNSPALNHDAGLNTYNAVMADFVDLARQNGENSVENDARPRNALVTKNSQKTTELFKPTTKQTKPTLKKIKNVKKLIFERKKSVELS